MEPLQVGGGEAKTPAAGAPEHFVDGGSLGVELVSGDVSFMGLGTTTYVEGTKVAGFGHPMMEAGNTAMPSCIGTVHWIMATTARSFKMGECARPLGALVQDRQSAIIVDETKTAPMFPVDMKLTGFEGAPKTQWHVDVAEEGLRATAVAPALPRASSA